MGFGAKNFIVIAYIKNILPDIIYHIGKKTNLLIISKKLPYKANFLDFSRLNDPLISCKKLSLFSVGKSPPSGRVFTSFKIGNSSLKGTILILLEKPFAKSFVSCTIESRTSQGAKDNEKICCSFCGKPQDAVDRLIAGHGVYICN